MRRPFSGSGISEPNRRASRQRTASTSFTAFRPTSPGTHVTYVDTIVLTHSMDAPLDALLAKGPQIVEAVAGGPLRNVKPYTREVRAEIDYELVAKSIAFMKRQKASGKPFFLYLPFSMGHFAHLPSKQFTGKSRIGQYGDKLMEGDYHVGRILDALKDLGVDDNTLVVFASDNGPKGDPTREFGNQGTPDMGNSGPFRGALGEASEGSIRTFAFIRWPSHVKPDTTRTRCSRSWISSRPSRTSSAAKCQLTGRSMASTRSRCCSARARPATATAF